MNTPFLRILRRDKNAAGMGVDLMTITGHDCDYKQIIRLQEKIESDDTLRSLSWWTRNPTPANWQTLMTAESLYNFWEHHEKQEEIDEIFFHDYLPLPTFFGELTFHRHIVVLESFAMRLWSLERDDKSIESLLMFNARLGKILNQKYIIYSGDSWAKSAWVDNWKYGKTINQIIQEAWLRGLGNIENVQKSVKDDNIYIQRL